MRSSIKSRCLFLVFYILLTACAGSSKPAGLSPADSLAAGSSTPAMQRDDIDALPTTTPTPTRLPEHTLVATASIQRPTAIPSRTPLPVVTLSVPDSWREKTLGVLGQLNQSADHHTWRLVDTEQADVQLVNNSSGVIVEETILALAVPFTLDWENINRDQVQEILKDGPESIILLPWPEMRANQKALRIDGLGPADSGYPLRESWSLVTDLPLTDSLEELALLLQEPPRDGVIHLAAVGDIMMDRSLGAVISQGDLLFPFSDVTGSLQEADITVGNLESALGDTGIPEPKSYTFRAPPEAADSLALAGFDIVSLANNHGMDFGAEALLQALELLQKQDLIAVGAGENRAAAYAPQVVTINGLKTAFFAYANVPVEGSTGFDVASWTAGQDAPGIAWADPQVVAENVRAVREQVDLIVILLHSGYEYLPAPSESQRLVARAAVEAGADLVIGHHAHVLQGIEYYQNGVIIYGTGNFAFDIIGPPETAIFHIWLDGDGVREIFIEPAMVQPGGKPRLADSIEAQEIRQRYYQLTNLLNIP